MEQLTPVDVGRAIGGELDVDDIPNATVDVLLERDNDVRNVPIEEFVSTAVVRAETEPEARNVAYGELSKWVADNLSNTSYAECDREQVFSDLQDVCDTALEAAFAIAGERDNATERNELRSKGGVPA